MASEIIWFPSCLWNDAFLHCVVYVAFIRHVLTDKALGVICHPVTEVTQVMSYVSPCGVLCGGQSDTGTVLRPSPVSVIPLMLHIY